MPIDFARAAGEGRRLAGSAFLGSSLVLAGLTPAFSAARVEAPVNLATAASYAVLADGAVANVGKSVINGDVGVHPGRQVSGFPPGVINGQRHAGDAVAERAQSDLTNAYEDAAGRTASRTVGPLLGGQTLTPGVYKAPDRATLTGTLTLDAGGDASAVFIIQLGSGLTTTPNSTVRVLNSPRPACNVFWTVGDSATLGANTSFVGRIMAVNGIRIQSAAKIEQGGALSRNGAVSLDANAVNRSQCPAAPTTTAPASPTSPAPSPTESPTTPGPGTTPPSPTTPAPVTPGTTAPETGVPAPSAPELTVPPPAAPAVPERRVPPPAAPAVPERRVPPPAAPAVPELPAR